MTDGMRFFGLLYLDDAHNTHANLKRSPIDPIEVYVACACLAARSAKSNGIAFSIFTNRPDFVAARFREQGLADVLILSLPFSLSVPKVKVFYSAHFKLDVIAALGSGRYGARVALVDVDTVFCKELPKELASLPTNAIAAYDVSRAPTYVHWHRHMTRDLSRVAAMDLAPAVWFGGEFLAGSATAFAELAAHVAVCWPRYVAAVGTMHHVGDETAVSAALNRMAKAGFPIVDLGVSRTVIRWWSTGTRYPQPAFDDIGDCFLLHLPADKVFLARQARVPFTKEDFEAAYRRYFADRYRRRKLLDVIRLWKPARLERLKPPATPKFRLPSDSER